MGALTLVLGGQKAGKSSAAMRLAGMAGGELHVVTPAHGGDPELDERIRRHRDDRDPSIIVHETFDIRPTLAQLDHQAVVVDALDTWLLAAMSTAGLLNVGDDPTPLGADGRKAQEAVLGEVAEIVRACADRAGPTFIVAGMVGMGMHGPTTTARRYEDLHGLALQQLGDAAERVLLVIAGRAIDLAALDVLP